LEITWITESCFLIVSENLSIITNPDPKSDIDKIIAPHQAKNSIVTTSNKTIARLIEERSFLKPDYILSGPGYYELFSSPIEGLSTMPDPEAIEPEQNILYKFKIEDISILHLGNIQSSLKPGQIEELSPVDIILLPAKNTLIELELAQFIQKIEAKLIIPIDNPEELNKTTNLLRELGAIVIEPRNKLNLKKNSLKENLQIPLLIPQYNNLG